MTGFTPEQVDAMGEQAGILMAEASAAGDLGIVLAPYAGPPPRAEFFLGLLKTMLEGTGEATGVITLGCGQYSGMVAVDLPVQTVLTALIATREADLLPPVDWVALAMDTYRLNDTDGGEPVAGAATEAFLRGDPNAEEALMALCYAPDGPCYDTSLPYTRTPTGIEWGDVEPEPFATGGAVPDLMRALIHAGPREEREQA